MLGDMNVLEKEITKWELHDTRLTKYLDYIKMGSHLITEQVHNFVTIINYILLKKQDISGS